jgi:hypothetical protein
MTLRCSRPVLAKTLPHGVCLPHRLPHGSEALRAFYSQHRFNNPALRAELLSRTVMGNKVFDHEKIYGIGEQVIENMAVYEVQDGLIKTAWFYFAE